MGALPNPDRYTETAYLALERNSDIRHEFFDGAVIAMSGGSETHTDIVSSLHVLLYQALRARNCKVYPFEMAVKSAVTNNYSYPDLTVVCGERQFADVTGIAVLLNPLIIVEVLSPSTEAFDRGKKFHHYQTIPSLQNYMLVAQEHPQVEVFARGSGTTWVLTQAHGLEEAIILPALDVTLPLAVIYEQITFKDDTP